MREDRNFSFSSTMNPIHYRGNPEVIYPQYRTSCWNRSPMKPFLLGLLFCTPSEGPGVKCHPGIHTGLWLVYTLTNPRSLDPPLSNTDRTSTSFEHFNIFQSCSTDAAKLAYQEFWSVWIFTSPPTLCYQGFSITFPGNFFQKFFTKFDISQTIQPLTDLKSLEQ